MYVATPQPQSCVASRPNLISRRLHAALDYCDATVFLGIALLCHRRNPAAAKAAAFTGSYLLLQALLTDYPLGVAPVLPFRTHAKMDAAFSAISPTLPKLLGFSRSAPAAAFRWNGAITGAILSLTDFRK